MQKHTQLSLSFIHGKGKPIVVTPQGHRGVQGRTPLDVPLWHVDYFKLKTIKAQKTQEETDLPDNGLKNLDKGPVPGTEQYSEIFAKNMDWVWWSDRGNTRVQPVSHCFCIAQKTFVYKAFTFLFP